MLYTKGSGKVEYKLKDVVNNHYPLSQSHYWSHTTNTVVRNDRGDGQNGTPNGETSSQESSIVVWTVQRGKTWKHGTTNLQPRADGGV